MSSRLTGLVIEAAEPAKLADFWASVLGWTAVGSVVRAPESDGCELDLIFVPESGPKRGKNRLHLDVASNSSADQTAKVEHAASLGARMWDIGQGDVPWTVLIDPAGNEFCVLDPRARYTTTEALAAIVVDAVDPFALASFWAGTIDWQVKVRESVVVGVRAPSGRGPWLEFLRTTESKRHPDRLRLALGGDPRAEAAQPRTDPEGNEFFLVA